MTDYFVSDTDLTSVADAIRAKGGTSAPLSFPTGFNTAISNIPTGGGGGGGFSSCAVTLVNNNSDDEYNIYIPMYIDDEYFTGAITGTYMSTGSTETVNVILYNGAASGNFENYSFPSQSAVATTGGVSYDGDQNLITITGPGTLTILS